MSILNKMISSQEIALMRDVYKNPPFGIGKKQIEDQKKFLKKIVHELMVERPIEKYLDQGIEKQDYEDVALFATFKSLNINLVKKFVDPEFCNNCGKCCTETDVIMLLDSEYKNLKKTIRDIDIKVVPHPQFPNQYTLKAKPCVFHDERNKKCTIYNRRPSVCKYYPISTQKIAGQLVETFVTLEDCNYSVQLVLKFAIITFDECLS